MFSNFVSVFFTLVAGVFLLVLGCQSLWVLFRSFLGAVTYVLGLPLLCAGLPFFVQFSVAVALCPGCFRQACEVPRDCCSERASTSSVTRHDADSEGASTGSTVSKVPQRCITAWHERQILKHRVASMCWTSTGKTLKHRHLSCVTTGTSTTRSRYWKTEQERRESGRRKNEMNARRLLKRVKHTKGKWGNTKRKETQTRAGLARTTQQAGRQVG